MASVEVTAGVHRSGDLANFADALRRAVESGAQEPPMSQWLHFIHPPREDFAATMTPKEDAIWDAHWEHLKRLYRQGVIILVGPTLGRRNRGRD